MQHEGQILKKTINESKDNRVVAALKVGLHPNTLSQVYKDSRLSEAVKERASAAYGIDWSQLGEPDAETKAALLAANSTSAKPISRGETKDEELARVKLENARLAGELAAMKEMTEKLLEKIGLK